MTNDAPLHGPLEKIAVAEWASTVTESWLNRTLVQVGESLVRVGVMEGEYHWHRHTGQDEFFLVLDGGIRIDVEDRPSVVLGPHEAYWRTGRAAAPPGGTRRAVRC